MCSTLAAKLRNVRYIHSIWFLLVAVAVFHITTVYSRIDLRSAQYKILSGDIKLYSIETLFIKPIIFRALQQDFLIWSWMDSCWSCVMPRSPSWFLIDISLICCHDEYSTVSCDTKLYVWYLFLTVLFTSCNERCCFIEINYLVVYFLFVNIFIN